MLLKQVRKGILTLIPGVGRILPKGRTGGTSSALYSYGVWLKHLTIAWENGLRSIPNTVAELGPGDSLGTGIAAMLSGVNNYYALDVTEFSNPETNVKIFDDLVDIFKSRSSRPVKGWPDFDQYLDSRLFPSHILTEPILSSALSEHRLQQIRGALATPGSVQDGISIKYMVPWSSPDIIEPNSVDFALSHSVLEHVNDVDLTYSALRRWLRPGGFMSHNIDFSCHDLAKEWNGHWKLPEWLWTLIRGKRTWLINREPCSTHLRCIKREGFEIVCALEFLRTDGIQREQLGVKWKSISDNDLCCAELFVQARCPSATPMRGSDSQS